MKHPCHTSEGWASHGPARDFRTRTLDNLRASPPAKSFRGKIPDTLDSLVWQLEDPDIFPLNSSGLRCSERGCVFPALPHSMGRCFYHDRVQKEPALFRSCQPTLALLDQAKFGLPDTLPDDSRSRDRRRLAALREKMLSGGTS